MHSTNEMASSSFDVCNSIHLDALCFFSFSTFFKSSLNCCVTLSQIFLCISSKASGWMYFSTSGALSFFLNNVRRLWNSLVGDSSTLTVSALHISSPVLKTLESIMW